VRARELARDYSLVLAAAVRADSHSRVPKIRYPNSNYTDARRTCRHVFNRPMQSRFGLVLRSRGVTKSATT